MKHHERDQAIASHQRQQLRSVSGTTSRTGFTLVELLMVIGILSILAGFLIASLNGAFSSARENQTRALLSMIDGVLQDRQQFFHENVIDGESGQYRYFRVANQVSTFSTRFAAANGGSSPAATSANYFVRKKLFATAFPQRFVDICGIDGRPGVPGTDDNTDGNTDFVGTTTIDLTEVGIGGDDPPVADVIRQAVIDRGAAVVLANHNPNTESAEILYLCITNPIIPGFSVLQPDQIPQTYIADTDNDGLLEFVDGYENPLRFYTFNTGLYRPTPWTWNTGTVRTDVSLEQAALAYEVAPRGTKFLPEIVLGNDASHRTKGINRDLDDRFNSVRSPSNAGLPAPDNLLADPFGYGTVTTAPLAPGLPISLGTVSLPMVVSAGADGVLGLGEPADDDLQRYATPEPASGIDAYDNLTSLQRGQL